MQHFRHIAKAAWEGLWEMLTTSYKYPESSGQQTKWSSMRGSNRAIFLNAFRQTPQILFLKCPITFQYSGNEG